MNAKTWNIGSDPRCDLVLEHPDVAPRHAVLERDESGHLWIEAMEQQRLDLCRNGQWLRAERLTVCAGDTIRVGGQELPTAQLAELAGAGVRLRSVRFPAIAGTAKERGPRALERPVRDPRTGMVAESGD